MCQQKERSRPRKGSVDTRDSPRSGTHEFADKAEPPQARVASPRRSRESRSVRSCVAEALAVSAFASLALFEANAMALRQAIQRAPMDAEKLRGELLVPARLLQNATHMSPDDVLEAEGGGASVSRGRGVEQPRWQVFRDQIGLRAQRRRALDRVLQLAHVPRPIVADEHVHRRRRDAAWRLVVRGGV